MLTRPGGKVPQGFHQGSIGFHEGSTRFCEHLKGAPRAVGDKGGGVIIRGEGLLSTPTVELFLGGLLSSSSSWNDGTMGF